MAYLEQKPHRGFCSKTLMLQVRFAHPPNPRTALSFLCAFPVGLFSVSAPNRLFKPLRCSAWLIQLRQRTALSPLKRSCSRFASLTLRTPHRPPVSSPLAAAAALWLPCVRGAVRRRAGLRGCLRIRGKGKGRRPSPVSAPNQLFELLRCFARLIRQAETHDLQPHSRPPSKRTALSPLKRSCSSRFAASEPRTVLPFLLH